MKQEKLELFLDQFGTLEDPRSERNRLYSMEELILTAICAAVCGADGWQDVEDFGNAKLLYLRSLLPFKNGIPSDDTFRRLFRALNPDAFQELFRAWVCAIQPSLEGKVIAIDGKCSRHTFDDETKMLHMVSAYATEARLVLAQEKVADKTNEITAIPTLLEWLDLRGAIVTIDAMGCQTKIAEQIQSQGGSYVFGLKGNQGSLLEDVSLFMNEVSLSPTRGGGFYEDHDKGHGRLETRRLWISQDIEWLHERHPQWGSIKSMIQIESTREIKGIVTKESRYYISSLVEDGAKMLTIIRSHWLIENGMHYVLDMAFGEDQSRIRKSNAPQVMAILRHMALNLLEKTKGQMKRQSIPRLRKRAGWDDAILSHILSNLFS